MTYVELHPGKKQTIVSKNANEIRIVPLPPTSTKNWILKKSEHLRTEFLTVFTNNVLLEYLFLSGIYVLMNVSKLLQIKAAPKQLFYSIILSSKHWGLLYRGPVQLREKKCVRLENREGRKKLKRGEKWMKSNQLFVVINNVLV